MPSSPDSAPSLGAVGALKTKGIPGESGKLWGQKVIKVLCVGGDFQRESQAQVQAWAGGGGAFAAHLRSVAMVPVKPKSLET